MDEKRPPKKNVNNNTQNPQKRAVKSFPGKNTPIRSGKTQNGRSERMPRQTNGGNLKQIKKITPDKKHSRSTGKVVPMRKRPDSKWKLIKAFPAFITDEIMNGIPLLWSKFRKTVVFRVISIILLAFTAVYFIGQIYRVYVIPVKTEIALEQTLYDNVTAEFFAVRDEKTIYNSKSGRIVPLVKDGDRVAKGDDIALIFSDDKQAASYTRMRELEEEIAYYEAMQHVSGVSGADIGHLNRQIQQGHALLSEASDNYDIESINESSLLLKDKLTRRQIATGQTVDFGEALKIRKEEYNKLKAENLIYSSVTAERSGYYISQTDGFENVLDYNNIDKVSAEQIESLLSGNAEPKNEKDSVGKLADGFNWYLFCVVDNETAKKTAVGKMLDIELPFSSVTDLKAVTVNMQPTADKQKTVITLKCSQMGSELAHLRREIGQIQFASYTGFKLSKDVIHEVDGEKGVYVLQGKKVKFRKINVIYTGDDFVIADNTGKDKNGDPLKNAPEYIKLHDKVIVKGENLSDGKLI